jgi:hypothetical protein
MQCLRLVCAGCVSTPENMYGSYCLVEGGDGICIATETGDCVQSTVVSMRLVSVSADTVKRYSKNEIRIRSRSN